MTTIRVGLVLHPENRDNWMLQKILNRLLEHVSKFGCEPVLCDKPLDDVQLNHHASWAFANIISPVPSTMFITHLDDIYKLKFVKSTLADQIDAGICMSSETVRQLADAGVHKRSLCFIPPAHDNLVRPRQIVIGITARVHSDGRKREGLLERIAGAMNLEAFEFKIFGMGWDRVVPVLRKARASVQYYPGTQDHIGDYELICKTIPSFDYYLYLGLDEGSLGTLDALAAGVKTIITPQGFHVDLTDGITHPIVSYDDLLAMLKSIIAEREKRIDSVRDRTWSEYARRHCIAWRHIIERRANPNVPEEDLQLKLFVPKPEAAALVTGYRSSRKFDFGMYLRALSPWRMAAAISHLPGCRSIRSFFRGGK